MGPRAIGAIGGLVPALVVAILLVAFGSPAPTREFIVPLAGSAVLALVVGWLVGPLATGSFGADLRALAVYALVAALTFLVVGALDAAWHQTTTGETPDLTAVAGKAAGLLLYGLLTSPFWVGYFAWFALVWVIAVRGIRGRAPSSAPPVAKAEEPGGSDQFHAIRPRRLALVAAAIILGYGLFVALIPLIQQGRGPAPPWSIYRPIALFGLFAVPAIIAAIGALRNVRPLLISAAVVCLLQAYIAFSGVTLGFLVPAVVLLGLGTSGRRWAKEPRASRTPLLVGVAVIGLSVAAWVVLLAWTGPRCWAGVQATDGTISVVEVPVTNATLNGPSEIPSGGSGCSSAELTIQGIGVSAVLAIGAIALAARAASAGRETRAA